MRYEIENRKGCLILYFYADITAEESKKLAKISPRALLNVGKDLGITPTICGTCIKFYKDGFKHVVTENDINAVKENVESFLERLKEFQVPETEPECPSHDTDDDREATDEEELSFVKRVLSDIIEDKNTDGIISAKLLDIISDQDGSMVFCPVGTIGGRTLKKCLQAYVRLYDKG